MEKVTAEWTSVAKQAWKGALVDRSFLIRALASIGILAATLNFMGNFLLWVEDRPGALLNDPVLALFDPKDVTVLTFVLIYLSLFVGLIHLIFRPESFLIALQAYTMLITLRMIMMFSIPLEAPAKLIPLVDPFVEIATQSKTLTKDLFFSGHTSTSFLLALTVQDKWLKRIFFISTVLVAGCVLIQHVHYFIDVAAAPFFAYTAYRLALALNERYFGLSTKLD